MVSRRTKNKGFRTMNSILILIILAFLSAPCTAQESTIDTNEKMLDATDDIMAGLEKTCEQFISWNHAQLKKNESLYRSLNDWDSQLSKLDQLKQQIAHTNELFIEFRNQCAETIALSFEGKAEKKEMHAAAQLSLTIWYTDFLKTFFPPRTPTPSTLKTPQD
jgi:hypothetical protein